MSSVIKREYIESRIKRVVYTALDEASLSICVITSDNGYSFRGEGRTRELSYEFALESFRSHLQFCLQEKHFQTQKRQGKVA